MPRTFSFLFFIGIASLSFAQSVPTNTAPIPTLHAGTHTVYVDVVVRDSQGKLTHGLTQQDFKVFQDGHPQQIRFFLEHNGLSPASTAQAAQEKLSEDEFSNVPSGVNQPGCVNIVLFDLLNTPSLEQSYARRQMLKFLKALPPGQQVALFLLSDKLHMLQGFTSSSDELVRAANQIDPKDFHLIRSSTQQMQDADWLNKFAAAIGRDPAGITERLAADQKREDATGQDIRARKTLDAFAALARATSGYPGRKNLLWLSETFPLTIGAVLTSTQFDHLDTQMLRQTADLIAAAHIAVYPISLTTLETDGIGAESNGTTKPTDMGKTLHDQFISRQELRSGMEDIAYETGGKAFYGTNDLARALEESLVDGASYYSLAYDPADRSPDQKWDGTYHKIHVELTRKGHSLDYRRGYFAVAPDTQSSQQTITRELSYAMQPGSPESTSLRMHARLVRPSNASPSAPKQPHLNCLLNTEDIVFSADPDGHHRAQLLMLLVRFEGPEESVIGAQTGGLLQLDFDPKQFEAVVQNGVPFNIEIPFKPGSNYISLGFIDQGSHHIGRLNLSLPSSSSPTASATP